MNLRNQLFLAMLLIGAFMTGCQKETFEPVSSTTQATLQAQAGVVEPDRQCGTSRTGTLGDEAGQVLGSATLLNDESNVYVILEMDNSYFVESVFAQFGTTAGIPQDNGSMVMEDFMFQDYIDGGKSAYTIIFPTSALPVCNDVVVHANIAEKNFFGQTIGHHQVWLGTNAIHDGFFFKYCLQTCN